MWPVPLLGRWILRGQGGLHHDGAQRGFPMGGVDRLRAALLGSYRAVLAAGLRHPWKVLMAVHAVLVASLLLVPGLGRQFFPPGERNQMLVDITLPEPPADRRPYLWPARRHRPDAFCASRLICCCRCWTPSPATGFVLTPVSRSWGRGQASKVPEWACSLVACHNQPPHPTNADVRALRPQTF